MKKKSAWNILDTGIASASRNMQMDAELLAELEASSLPILHFYDWDAPSATYGHFIRPHEHLSLDYLAKEGMQLAKRPTGGGIIFHTVDWAFSVLIPKDHEGYSINTLDNYAFVNQMVIQVIRQFTGCQAALGLLSTENLPLDQHVRNFCMAKPTKYDVILNGKKIGGGAQRRTRAGFLHQGTISLTMPENSFLESALIPGTCVHQAMLENTHSLLGNFSSQKDLEEARQSLKEIFIKILEI